MPQIEMPKDKKMNVFSDNHLVNFASLTVLAVTAGDIILELYEDPIILKYHPTVVKYSQINLKQQNSKQQHGFSIITNDIWRRGGWRSLTGYPFVFRAVLDFTIKTGTFMAWDNVLKYAKVSSETMSLLPASRIMPILDVLSYPFNASTTQKYVDSVYQVSGPVVRNTSRTTTMPLYLLSSFLHEWFKARVTVMILSEVTEESPVLPFLAKSMVMMWLLNIVISPVDTMWRTLRYDQTPFEPTSDAEEKSTSFGISKVIKTWWNCARCIYEEQGWMGFYRSSTFGLLFSK